MSHLVSCSILETTKFGDCTWAWAFPSMTETQKDHILKKTPIEKLKTSFYGKFRNLWFYVSDLLEGDPQKFKDVSNFSMVLWSRDFNPDKYKALGRFLGDVYGKSSDPTEVLQHFISMMTIDICNESNLTSIEPHPNEKQKTGLKDLIKLFGLEAIIIYSAILLKKRIIVYHHGLLPLLDALKLFPSFMPTRSFDEVIFPWLELTDEGIASLRNRRFFIAGCYDNGVLSRLELTDVLVNIPAKEITISPHAKDGLAMTKVQKDIAILLTQLAESESPEEEVIKSISEKTKEVISNMKSLASVRDDGRHVLYISKLKANDISGAMESFYVQLATAENILVLDSDT